MFNEMIRATLDIGQPIRLSALMACRLERAAQILESVQDHASDDRLLSMLNDMADELRCIITNSERPEETAQIENRGRR